MQLCVADSFPISRVWFPAPEMPSTASAKSPLLTFYTGSRLLLWLSILSSFWVARRPQPVAIPGRFIICYKSHDSEPLSQEMYLHGFGLSGVFSQHLPEFSKLEIPPDFQVSARSTRTQYSTCAQAVGRAAFCGKLQHLTSAHYRRANIQSPQFLHLQAQASGLPQDSGAAANRMRTRLISTINDVPQ